MGGRGGKVKGGGGEEEEGRREWVNGEGGRREGGREGGREGLTRFGGDWHSRNHHSTDEIIIYTTNSSSSLKLHVISAIFI